MKNRASLCNRLYKVHDEGENLKEYQKGLTLLASEAPLISAIAFPGIGIHAVLDEACLFFPHRKPFFLVREEDLYDLMTQRTL